MKMTALLAASGAEESTSLEALCRLAITCDQLAEGHMILRRIGGPAGLTGPAAF